MNWRRYFGTLGGCLIAALLGFLTVFAFQQGVFTPLESGRREEANLDGRLNVLVLGVDADGRLTDTIILASYNLTDNTAKLLSIPRDTRIKIDGKYHKINAAHALTGGGKKIRGAQGSMDAVEALTGLSVDYYVEFSFDALDQLMDALGPVTFDVPDVQGGGRGMNYEDPEQDLYIHLKPGVQELSGNQVQQLLRFRRYRDGDIGRVRMQQEFLKELANQKLNASLCLRIPKIYRTLKKEVETDMSFADIVAYANHLKNFDVSSIETFSLPGNFLDTGTSYWECDQEKWEIIKREHFLNPEDPV